MVKSKRGFLGMIMMFVIVIAVLAGGFLYFTAKTGGNIKVTTGNIVVDINYSNHDNSSLQNSSLKDTAQEIADKIQDEAQEVGKGALTSYLSP
jgi:hypothetical protein